MDFAESSIKILHCPGVSESRFARAVKGTRRPSNLIEPSAGLVLPGSQMADLAAQVAKRLYNLALAAYDGARGRIGMEGAG